MNDTRTPQVDDTNTETDDEKSGDDDSESPPTAPPIQNAAPPSPSPIRRRLGRILFWIALIWAAFKLYSSLISMEKKKPEITYASWYSNEFKFRPAASPVITETLKDGRIRLRGAYPEPTAVAVPQSQSQSHGKKKKKNSKRKKRG